MKDNRLREWVPRHAFDHPVAVLMAFLAMLLIGGIAWVRIPVQMLPDGINPGFLWVQVPYPNASPSEVDDKIVRPIEAQLGTVPGISSIRSRASSGSAGFGVEFHGAVDMTEAYNAVVDRLERAQADLPEDVERYWVYQFDPNDTPILWAGVMLPDDMEDPYHVMTRVVQPRLERIPGVARLDIWGVPQRSVWIDYDKQSVYAHGVDLGTVTRKLRSENVQMSSGKLEDKGQVKHARALARIDDLDDLRRFPIKDGVVLEDIATVEMRAAMSSSINRINGEEAAGIAVQKESSANTVEVADRVAAVFEELEADPRVEGAQFFVFFSQGELVEESVWVLTEATLVGGLFAVIILYLFLREWKMTLLISTSIPFSLLLTVAVLYFRGDSLNILSLMGLMLAVGMVVDDAIVVVETIYRHRAEGAGIRAAAIAGTGEVNLAVILSTLTTMVVFLPMILMSENATFAFFMGVLGFPVVFALAASLVVALVFAPLATRYMGRAEIKPDPVWVGWIANGYRRTLFWSLKHRVDAAMALIAMGLLTMGLAVPGVSCSGVPEENLNDFSINFELPPQMGTRERHEVVDRIEAVVAAHQDAWGVRVYSTDLQSGRNRGDVTVYLVSDPPMEREAVMEAAREVLPDDIPGVTTSIGWEAWDAEAASGGESIRLQIHGEDLDTLQALAEEVERRVEHVPGVMAVHLDVLNDGADEVRLKVDRQATGRHGVSAMQIGQTVAFAMRQNPLTPLQDDDKEVEVVAGFEPADRAELDTLLDFEVWSPETFSLVPIRSLTDTEVGKAPGQIRREDRQTGTGITIDLEDGVNGRDAYDAVGAALADMVFPRGYSWSKGRDFNLQMEDDAAMKFALILSICFVFLLMGVLFDSWVLPLAVVTTIPMALMGAVWALYLTGTALDTMAGVGFVILVGVIVKNGIVLIDLVAQLRADGMARDEALLEAGQRRLRPILMTALCTISGLIPMAVGSSGFIGIPYAPLGRTVIGGMVAGTLLTLLFVPYLYTLLDDMREAAAAWWGDVRRAS